MLWQCGHLLNNPTKEIHNDSILIATSTADGYPYGASIDVSISIKECDTIYTPLAVGDEIVVYYDGKMAEGNPALVNTVYAITLKTPQKSKLKSS